MILEEKFSDKFRITAFHPNAFTYAWKRKDLEKLFEEIMLWNIAITSCEVWLLDGKKTQNLIPLQNGDIRNFDFKIEKKDDEQWYDFVERSTKETLAILSDWDLERTVRLEKRNNIWYHFGFAEE